MDVDRTDRAAVGRYGEELAARMLEGAGWVVVDRNWRGTRGELDLVALDGRELVVVEVKTRTGLGYGHPSEAVTPRKLARLRRLAGEWLSGRSAEAVPVRPLSVRVDVVGVLLEQGRPPRVDHFVGVL
jgi:putative endonuclease